MNRFWYSTKGPLKSIAALGITNKNILINPPVNLLYENALKEDPVDNHTPKNEISSTGALVAYSGKRTGRSPADKRIVVDNNTFRDIWWGSVNMPLEAQSYKLLQEMAVNYINTRPKVYIIDGYGGWDKKYRQRIRTVCTREYHALFMKNMLIKPTQEEWKRDFEKGVDFTILNAGELPAPTSSLIKGINTNSKCSISLNFQSKTMTILGTQYAGEMKKGVFTIMNYLMPKRKILSLHSSANEGKNGDTTLLFGLSGTGKTTLSADPKRKLIGDDEHCWTNEGIFNIEGGCYAKCINLNAEKEPEIYNSIKYGTVLENIIFKDKVNKIVDYDSEKITENTRASYPLDYIKGAKIPAVGGHPKNVILLTCDSFGVLPPVSKLTPNQAMYHFLSGYTAKVAGTEVGVKEPSATFSSCFGSAFLAMKPTVYGKLLAEKIKKHKTNAWLVNTGWTGGKYGVGKRMDLKITRKIIDAIHDGSLANAPFELLPIFNLAIPKKIKGIPDSVLNPKNTWKNKKEYDQTLLKLAKDFIKNMENIGEKISGDILKAGPIIKK